MNGWYLNGVLFSSFFCALFFSFFQSWTFVSSLLTLCFGFFLSLMVSFKKQRSSHPGVFVLSQGWMMEPMSGDERFYKFILNLGLAIVSYYQFLYYFYLMDGKWRTLNPNNLQSLSETLFRVHSLERGFSDAFSWLMSDGGVLQMGGKLPLMEFWFLLWKSLGLELRTVLFLSGLFLTWVLARELRSWMGHWGIVVFFMSGGFRSLSSLPLGKDWLPSSDLFYKNFFLTQFVPRPYLWISLPLGIWLLRNAVGSWFSRDFLSSSGGSSRASQWGLTYFAFAMLLLSVLHPTTYWFLTLFFGIYFVSSGLWRLGFWLELALLVWGLMLYFSPGHFTINLQEGFLWIFLFLQWQFYILFLKKRSFQTKAFIAILFFFPGFYHMYSSLPYRKPSVEVESYDRWIEGRYVMDRFLNNPADVKSIFWLSKWDHSLRRQGLPSDISSNFGSLSPSELTLELFSSYKFVIWSEVEKNHFYIEEFPFVNKEDAKLGVGFELLYGSKNFKIYKNMFYNPLKK